MQAYLERFHQDLVADWKGSLVKVADLQEKNAKEYMNQAARAGLVERVRWGWYWVIDETTDVRAFLEKDRHFKVIAGQSAASYWNLDFVHRDICLVKVRDESYGKALEAFASSKGWQIQAQPLENSDNGYRKIGKLLVESPETTVIECMQDWAFLDALAVLYAHPQQYSKIAKESYWRRISRSDVRVRQALAYSCAIFNEKTGTNRFPTQRAKIEDEFLREQLDEAIEKVIELG